MSYRNAAGRAMDLSRAGWKVRQVAGRRIWYKGQAGAEIVAQSMDHAEQMEMTLRRCRAPSLFMYGPDVAELLGASPPPPPPKLPRPIAAVECWAYTDPMGNLVANVHGTAESAETGMCFHANRVSPDPRRSDNCVRSPQDNLAAKAEGWRVVPVKVARVRRHGT